MHELVSLLLDWHHWAFEVVSGAILGATLTPLWRWIMRRHDRKRHGGVVTHDMLIKALAGHGRLLEMEMDRRMKRHLRQP